MLKLIVITIFLITQLGFAMVVEVEGIGSSCEEAHRDAQYNALMNNNAIMEISGEYDLEDLNEKIISSANRLIVSSNIIQSHTSSDGQCSVAVKIEISDENMSQAINSILNNKAQLENFQKNEFAGKRVVLVYPNVQTNEIIFGYHEEIVQELMNTLRKEMIGKQFEIQNITLDTTSTENNTILAEISKQSSASAIVVIKYKKSNKCFGEEDCKYRGYVTLEVYNPQTLQSYGGEFTYEISSFMPKAKTDNDLLRTYRIITKKVIPKVTEGLITNVISYFKINRSTFGNMFILKIQGLDTEAVIDLKALLREAGYRKLCKIEGKNEKSIQFKCDRGKKDPEEFSDDIEFLLIRQFEKIYGHKCKSSNVNVSIDMHDYSCK